MKPGFLSHSPAFAQSGQSVGFLSTHANFFAFVASPPTVVASSACFASASAFFASSSAFFASSSACFASSSAFSSSALFASIAASASCFFRCSSCIASSTSSAACFSSSSLATASRFEASSSFIAAASCWATAFAVLADAPQPAAVASPARTTRRRSRASFRAAAPSASHVLPHGAPLAYSSEPSQQSQTKSLTTPERTYLATCPSFAQ